MKRKLALLAILSFLSTSLWAQNAVLNLDQGSSTSVFVDVGGGVEQTSFTVSGNLQTLVFMIAFQAGNPIVQFVSPMGVVLDFNSPGVSVQMTSWGFLVGLQTPALGTWALQLSQTLGAGSYQVSSFSVPAVPTASITTPTFSQEPWSSSASVTGQTQPDQAGKTVTIMLTQSRAQMTGIVAGQTTVAADGSFAFQVSPSEFTQGEYFVVALIDESPNPSIKAMAPGSLMRSQPPLLTAVQGVVAIVEQPTTLDLSFTNPFGRLPVTFHVHVLDSTGLHQIIDVGTQTKIRLTGFPLGQAQVWLTGLDSLGREGTPSPPASITFGSPPSTPPPLNLASPSLSSKVLVGQGAAAVTFALAGSYSPRGPSSDYAEAQVGPIPEGVTIQPTKNQWYLPTDSANLTFQVAVTSIAAPGTYTIPFTFATVGTPSNSVTGTLSLEVTYPSVSVNSVTPAAWLAATTPALTINGGGFFAGTKVFLDGIELAVAWFSTQSMQVVVPATLAAGVHTLAVQGADKSTASTTVTVNAPNYNLVAQKSVSQNVAGTQARFWVGLQPLNGFQGQTQIHVSGLAPGWTTEGTPFDVTSTEPAVVTVQIPSDATPGDYHLTATTTEDGQLGLTVTVVTTPPSPFVSSISTYAALAGDSFWLYGYGFGNSKGQVTVGAQSWTVVSWSDDLIQVTVPQDAQTGLLRAALPSGRLSNGITFGVKDYGFQFQTGQTVFVIQGGDSPVIPVQLTGFRQPVNLQVQSSSPLVAASLDQTAVVPLGLVNLKATVDKNIPNGTYKIVLTGASGSFQTGVTFQLVVGSAMTFATTQIPVVLQNTNYAANLFAVNAVGTATFGLDSGVLPQGLTLDSTGLVSGRATQAGLFRVVFQVSDTVGHKTSQEFKLFVAPTGWFTYGRDEGRTWYEPVDSPADARILWTGPALGSPATLLAGGSSLFVLTADGIKALYATKGSVLFSIPGSFSSIQYHKNTLIALGTDGTLHAYETGYGNQIWQRSGIVRYWITAGTILADLGTGQIQQLDANLGTLSGTFPGDLAGTLVGWRGKLYRLQNQTLQCWSGAQSWTTAYQSPVALVLASADGKALYLAGQDGSVRLWNGTQATLLWTGKVKSMVLSPDWLAVDTGSSVEIRDRISGTLRRNLAGGDYDALFGAKDKLFAIRGGHLSALNLTYGNTIWQTGSQIFQALLFGDQLFSIDTQGVVADYNAPDDLLPPVTTLITTPARPDGLNGWFVTDPQISLSATDAATSVANTFWKVDSGPWGLYTGALTLTNGIHTLGWYSIDAKGFRETDKTATVNVDSNRPVTTAQTDTVPLTGLPGIWGTPVQVTLNATEVITGVAQTRYRIGGGDWQTYAKPIVLSTQGFYTLDYQSQSKAGGWEMVHTLSLTLDFNDPTANADVQSQVGAAFVFLTGSTSPIIGIDRLEYKIGSSGTVQTYTQAVSFTQSGQWTLLYRAVDKAGRSSVWQSINVQNQALNATDALERVTYGLSSQGRSVNPSVNTGSLIFSGTTDRFLTLPPQLVGAAYFLGKNTDGQSSVPNFITITFGRPVTVYYLENPDSRVVLSGWAAGPIIPPNTLSTKYFTGSLQIWSKVFQAGDKVVFPGPGLKHTGGDLIFVQALWTGVQIVAPAPGQVFLPGQSVDFRAFTGLSPASLTWSVQDANQPWKIVGTGSEATYTVSPQDDGGRLSVRVSALASHGQSPEASTGGDWAILFQEKLKIRFPSPDFPALAQTSLTPKVLFTDAYGTGQAPPPLNWTLSLGGRMLYTGASPIPVGPAGSYQLTTTGTSPSGKVLTDTISFRATAGWPWVRWHWYEKHHQAWNEAVGEGFWDHGDALDESRDGQTKTGKKTLPVWTWNRGAEYRFAVPNGTYELRLVLGPFHAWDVATATINGQAVNLMSKTEGGVQSVRFVVKVTDGTFHIQGSAGMPFYRFEYRPTDNNSSPSAAVEGSVDTLEDLQ